MGKGAYRQTGLTGGRALAAHLQAAMRVPQLTHATCSLATGGISCPKTSTVGRFRGT
jgi:hypothetical protein